ncbi:MAG: hypothetical protein ACRDDY_00710 [Clostridium sp.]|uniref:hypothetical protein n=1 Tax=Clostridium sp. TaxID=1506 RepID=UPI003EE460A3
MKNPPTFEQMMDMVTLVTVYKRNRVAYSEAAKLLKISRSKFNYWTQATFGMTGGRLVTDLSTGYPPKPLHAMHFESYASLTVAGKHAYAGAIAAHYGETSSSRSPEIGDVVIITKEDYVLLHIDTVVPGRKAIVKVPIIKKQGLLVPVGSNNALLQESGLLQWDILDKLLEGFKK